MKSKENKNIPTLSIPLITQDDLHHNELWWLVTILTCRIFKEKNNRCETCKYILKVYNIINKISSCISTINQSKGFIRRRPSIKQLDNNDQMTITGYYMGHLQKRVFLKKILPLYLLR